MTPVPEWRRVLRHAWSIRWMGAALIFGIGESVTAVLDPPDSLLLRIGLAVLTAICAVGGLVSRVMVQKELGE